MAKTNYTVDGLLSVVSTGLEGDDLQAFKAFCQCELGAIKALAGDDTFAGLRLKGKGDKAKGTYNGAKVEFKQGHNAATLVMSFACLVLKEADGLGILPPTVDCSQICTAWKERRERAGKNTVNA